MSLKITKKYSGIIRPVRGKNEPSVGPDALMVMIPSDLKYLVQEAEAEQVSFNDINFYHLYQKRDGNRPLLTLSGPFLGAPHAVIAMEKLIVLGAKRIWVLGWCGSLQRNLRTGHIIIPSTAIPEEGTSGHYSISDQSPQSDARLNSMLEESLRQRNLPFSTGSVWTTDALYRETSEKVKAYQDQGVLAVEMEISALMTVSLYRSTAMAGLLVVSDELFDLKWRPGFSNPLLKRNSHSAGKILLDLAGGLAQNDTAENVSTEAL
ncbi:MAG TPA: hypothetical protein DDW42_02825 [Desulfobacteraceae bacterium]|nr:hypothetical protein [Desulfobacteraceae bacterium]